MSGCYTVRKDTDFQRQNNTLQKQQPDRFVFVQQAAIRPSPCTTYSAVSDVASVELCNGVCVPRVHVIYTIISSSVYPTGTHVQVLHKNLLSENMLYYTGNAITGALYRQQHSPTTPCRLSTCQTRNLQKTVTRFLEIALRHRLTNVSIQFPSSHCHTNTRLRHGV